MSSEGDEQRFVGYDTLAFDTAMISLCDELGPCWEMMLAQRKRSLSKFKM